MYGEWLAEEALEGEGTGDFKIESKVTGTTNYAYDLVLLTRKFNICLTGWWKWKEIMGRKSM